MSIEKHEYETYYKFDVDLRFHFDFDFLQIWEEKKRPLLLSVSFDRFCCSSLVDK